MYYLGINVHKDESHVAVLDSDGEINREIRVENANLDEVTQQYESSLWSDEGREFPEELTLEEPSQMMLEHWLDAIDEFTEKIKRIQREIERKAAAIEELETLMTAPGIAAYSGLMVHGEIGEVERFDRANEVVSYAGLDPTVRESGDSRTAGDISKEGNRYLRWILVQCTNTAVRNAKDPYLSEFYWRLREKRNKEPKVALVATARKLLVSLFHMLKKNEPYDPAGVST
jgi:transposase